MMTIKNVPDALADLGAIYRERHGTYGDTDKTFGKVMKGLFPQPVTLSSEADWSRMALFCHCVDKIARYASSFGHGGHGDSCDDVSVYAQMLREMDGETAESSLGSVVATDSRHRQIIGLAGVAGSGKSTAATILVETFGFVRLRFAGPIKAMMKCLGLSDAEVDGHLKESPCKILGGKTPRHAMQTLGTEWGRQMISDSLWLDIVKAGIASIDPGSVVIDDVRFDNEACAIRDVGGILIRIARPEVMVPRQIHPSETASFPVDHVIINNGTMAEFAAEVKKIRIIEFDPDGSVR